MPLTEPVPRNLIHERSIVCRGFCRDDGLWDIEGHLVDTKTYPFANRHRGEIRAGEPIHEMWLRLTIDEDLLVHAAEAATEHAPYAVCPRITPNFEQLAGLRIGPGWTRAVRSCGSTLISELTCGLKSMTMALFTAWPASEVPPPRERMSSLFSAQYRTIFSTSSIVSGITTPTGSTW